MQNICVDFDGCIHSYENGWQGGKLYGTVVPGFFQWVNHVKDGFNINVYSSRSCDPIRKKEMQEWIEQKYIEEGYTDELELHFPDHKPPSMIYIDDRAYRFEGNWRDIYLNEAITSTGVTWTQKSSPIYFEVFSFMLGRFVDHEKESSYQSFIEWLQTFSNKHMPNVYYFILGSRYTKYIVSDSAIQQQIIQMCCELAIENYEHVLGNFDSEIADLFNFFNDRGAILLDVPGSNDGQEMYKKYLRIKLES